MTLPLLSTATPAGQLNEAPAPVPSANVADPLPASVVTTPPGVSLRMRWLFLSATMTLPLLSTATPEGSMNKAPAPAPSENPYDPPPASVVTTPPGVTLRMRWLLESATMTLPLLSTATPVGK
jgi:hypothetical protein